MVGQEPSGDEVEERIRRVAEIQRAAAEYAAARYSRDAVIRAAHDGGIPIREIGLAAGLSFQRVHQILRSK